MDAQLGGVCAAAVSPLGDGDQAVPCCCHGAAGGKRDVDGCLAASHPHSRS